MSGYRKATRFITRIIAGSLIALFLGNWIDEQFKTTPLIMLALLFYVLFGSLVLLIRETGGKVGRKD